MGLVGSIDTDAFYRYQGSLTTPSCNEVVRWTVFKDTLKINRFLARQFLRQVGHDDTTPRQLPRRATNGRSTGHFLVDHADGFKASSRTRTTIRRQNDATTRATAI